VLTSTDSELSDRDAPLLKLLNHFTPIVYFLYWLKSNASNLIFQQRSSYAVSIVLSPHSFVSHLLSPSIDCLYTSSSLRITDPLLDVHRLVFVINSMIDFVYFTPSILLLIHSISSSHKGQIIIIIIIIIIIMSTHHHVAPLSPFITSSPFHSQQRSPVSRVRLHSIARGHQWELYSQLQSH